MHLAISNELSLMFMSFRIWLAHAPKHIEHIRSLFAENQMVSWARKEEGFHATLHNVSTVDVLPDSKKKKKGFIPHKRRTCQNFFDECSINNTNLVPRSPIDEAEGEIWSNPILYT